MTSSNGNIFGVTGPLSPVNSPHEGQWHEALLFSLTCAWTNGWVNNRVAGDLTRHSAHYDVIVICSSVPSSQAVHQSIHTMYRILMTKEVQRVDVYYYIIVMQYSISIRPKVILKSNLAKYLELITYFPIAQSFTNVHRTAVILPCFVQNWKMIG